MQPIGTAVLFGIASAVCSLTAVAAEAPGEHSGAQPARAICQEAVVSPVSGYAECVKPRGAAVAPPPKRPDAVRPAGGADLKPLEPGH